MALDSVSSHGKADYIRSRIQATVRRTPQVMVKVTREGRGMKAIAAHFRYISKNGRFEIEDDRGATQYGKEALHALSVRACRRVKGALCRAAPALDTATREDWEQFSVPVAGIGCSA